MTDDATLAQINGEHGCPTNAGPAWREAMEYGFDMSLVEENLLLSPEQRLEKHQRALNLILKLKAANDDAAKRR